MKKMCNCAHLEKISVPLELKEMEENCLIKLSIDGNLWHTFYQCKYCNVFWEERYTGGRWDGWPELHKVTPEYVVQKWGPELKSD